MWETSIKRDKTKMPAGLSWPSEMQAPDSDILIPRVQSTSHGFFSFSEKCGFPGPLCLHLGLKLFSLCVCSKFTPKQSPSFANFPTGTKASVRIHLPKGFEGKMGKYSTHPTLLNLKVPSHTLPIFAKCLSAAPLVEGRRWTSHH